MTWNKPINSFSGNIEAMREACSDDASSHLFKAIQTTLPNFPAEVINEWLLPFAKYEGWPPAPNETDIPLGRWRYILRKAPINFYQSLVWKKINGLLTAMHLSEESQETVVNIFLGAVKGENNYITAEIRNLTQRFNGVLEYIRQTGRLPKPPCLLYEGGKLVILDGNHRISAFLYCTGNFKIKIEREIADAVNVLQDYWVCQPDQTTPNP